MEILASNVCRRDGAQWVYGTWLGERVEADIRTTTYSHIVGLSPVLRGLRIRRSPLAVDERYDRGSPDDQYSVTSTLKSLFIILGGVTLLMVTSPKLAGSVLLMVPLAVVPVVLFGRPCRLSGRRRSRARA